jgi:exoribonuclease R
MVSNEWLNSNNLFVDSENFCINNFNNGESYRLGDEVIAKVTKVNMQRKQIDSILIL